MFCDYSNFRLLSMKSQYQFSKKSKDGGEKVIYEKIKVLCNEKGISICALEKAAGLGNGTIRGWKNSSPTIDKLQAVAKVLEVKVNKLIE